MTNYEFQKTAEAKLLSDAAAQAAFDAAVDARDIPSGATKAPDAYVGS